MRAHHWLGLTIGSAGVVLIVRDWWLALAPDLRVVLMQMAVLFGVPALLVLAFLAFAWPTCWRYENASSHLVRITRLTGTVSILTPQGWVRLSDMPKRIDA